MITEGLYLLVRATARAFRFDNEALRATSGAEGSLMDDLYVYDGYGVISRTPRWEETRGHDDWEAFQHSMQAQMSRADNEKQGL